MRKIFHVETVVVPLCSGLADQIGWYGYGEEVREKHHLPIKYCIRWFQKKGVDEDGVFARPLQLKQFLRSKSNPMPVCLKIGCTPYFFGSIAMQVCAKKKVFAD